ncbi:MAG: glycosyltransferase family 2 protein [Pseudomonadota bacterium]
MPDASPTDENQDHRSTTAMRSVSAVVVSYFTGPLLGRAIASLKRQPEIDEIILVDNGNWPGAVDAAVAASPDGAPVLVISGHGNVGFATACNLGAKRANAEFLLFLNPDAEAPAGAVAGLMAAADTVPSPFLIGPKLLDPDGSEQQGGRREVLTPWSAFVEITKLHRLAPNHPSFRRFNLHEEPCPGSLCETPTISGACFFLRREDYFSIGGMDERYFLHVEDVDFCLRFKRAGGQVYYNPLVAIPHNKSSSRVSAIRVERRKTTSMILYFKTHFQRAYPPGFLFVLNGLLWSAFGVKAMRRLLFRVRPSLLFGSTASRARRINRRHKER